MLQKIVKGCRGSYKRLSKVASGGLFVRVCERLERLVESCGGDRGLQRLVKDLWEVVPSIRTLCSTDLLCAPSVPGNGNRRDRGRGQTNQVSSTGETKGSKEDACQKEWARAGEPFSGSDVWGKRGLAPSLTCLKHLQVVQTNIMFVPLAIANQNVYTDSRMRSRPPIAFGYRLDLKC